MKKALSLILAAAMMLTLIVVPAMAVDTTKVDVVLTPTADGITVESQVSGNSAVGGVTVCLVFDSTVLGVKGVDAVPADNMISDKVTFIDGFAATYGKLFDMGNNQMGLVLASLDYSASKDATNALTFASVELAYKAGKSIDDVSPKAIRMAKQDEVNDLGEEGPACVMNGDASMNNNPTTTLGAGFDWALLPLEGTVALDGTATDGETLTANTTGITNADPAPTFTYAWYRGDEVITGATAATYTLTPADAGKIVKVVVSASNYSGKMEAATAQEVAKTTPVAQSITLKKDGTALSAATDTLVKPVDDTNVEHTYTAVPVDQYGDEMAAVELTKDAASTSDAAYADGKVTVTKDTTVGDVVLKATSGSVNATLTVKVTNISFAGVEDGVKATDGVYGAKLGDLVKIDASKITATAGSAVAGTYTLVDADTVPAAGDAVAYTVVFNSDDETYQNIVVAEGTVKVAKKDVTVTADNVRVDLKKELPTEWTCTIEGLLEGDELTGTATFVINNGEAVDTSVKGEYTIAVSGLTDESGNYNVTFVDGTLTVKKKNTTPPAYGTGTNPDGTEKDPDDHPTTDTSVFDDVKEGDWFYDAVNYVAENKLMTGTADKIFEPNTNTSRAMIATILWRQSGSPEPVARIADFPDVDADAWYIKAVRWCAEKEIVTGYENGNFGPNDLITREQMAAMFYRYAGSPEVDAAMGMAGFTDVDAISEWAATAMRWAVQNGILNGKDGGMLDPQGLATRAETAAVLQRYLSKK